MTEYAIVYSSQTGNTALLAETLRETLPGEQCRYFGPPEGAADAPLLLVGFWTDRGDCDERSAAYLASLRDRKVFLFGSAGFGGSDSYYRSILGKVRAHLDDSNQVVGSFLCQGKMQASVLHRLTEQMEKNPGDRSLRLMFANYERAAAHPDEADLQALRRAAADLSRQ